MAMNRIIRWSFVVEPVGHLEDAEKLAAGLSRHIPKSEFTKPRPYHKFPDSFLFYLTTELGPVGFDQAVVGLIRYGSDIANDWLHTCYPEDEMFSMVFNRGPHVQFRLEAFLPIRWISAELDKT